MSHSIETNSIRTVSSLAPSWDTSRTLTVNTETTSSVPLLVPSEIEFIISNNNQFTDVELSIRERNKHTKGNTLQHQRKNYGWCVAFFCRIVPLILSTAFLVLFIGKEYEQYHVRKQPSTLFLYETSRVCTISKFPGRSVKYNSTLSSSATAATSASIRLRQGVRAPVELLGIQTFPNKSTVHKDSIIAHCGDCGSCSNPQDIRIYDDTKSSLFGTALECSKRAVLGGGSREAASTCMKEQVGFTGECHDCWVENIMCDLQKCIFTCTWHSLFSGKIAKDSTSSSSSPQELNRCTECDERRCGIEFVQCAGANRRRSGILSDIKRDLNLEVCMDVKPTEWWKDDHLLDIWKRQTRDHYS